MTYYVTLSNGKSYAIPASSESQARQTALYQAGWTGGRAAHVESVAVLR